MATSPVPAPSGALGSAPSQYSQQGPGPGGGFPSPAPAQTDERGAQLLKVLLGVVSSMRVVAQQVPAATSEVRQINDLVAQVIGKVKSSAPPAETQAPPV